MKRIAVFLLLICLMFSCGKNNLRNVKKMINRGEIEKVEKLIEEGKIQSEEQVRELIFNKILTDIMLYAKKSEFDKINEILNEREFKQEQYNLICEKVYNAFNSYNSVMELIDSKLPPDSYCFDDTLLMCAVRAQNAECVKKLLAKGADVSKNDQNTKYNALFLSISFNTKDSVEIFKEILNKTKIKDGMCGTIPDRMTQSAGYFEAMLIFNQKEMMDLFLQKEGVKEMVLKQTDTLKILTKYPNYKDIVPSDIVNYDLVVNDDEDYFFNAIVNYNYEIIPVLMDKNVHLYCKGKDEFIKDFISNPRTRKLAGLFELNNGSEEYEKIVALSPVIKKYYYDDPLFVLFNSNLNVFKLDSKYSIVTNDDLDNPIKLDKEYVVSGFRLEPDKKWYLLVDRKARSIVRYINDMHPIGGFYIDGDYFVFDGGTSTGRDIHVYGINDKSFCRTGADALGKNYIFVNSKQKKVAVQFASNKSFIEGVDKPDTARVGIRVIDMVTNEVQELVPDRDVNYLLHSFDDDLLYEENGVVKVFPIK